MWNGKTIWITGASSGIGQALAVEFAKQGANLVLSARTEAALRTVEEECKSLCPSMRSLVLPLDVTHIESIPAAVKRVNDEFESIDLLINNAGISQRSSCLRTDMETYRAIFEVDVFGQIALTKAVLPIMIEQGRGHIAVTASVAGKMGVPFRTGYCAAKHAVMGFFDALRSEVSHQNITVSTIVPGFIQTNISVNALAGDGSTFSGADRDVSGGMSAVDCAKVVVRGLGKKRAEIAVGKGAEMHALWIKRLFPNFLNKLLVKQYYKRVNVTGYK